MKSKKAIYLLIALVVVIWGAIVFRIVKHLKSPEVPEMEYLPIATTDNYFKKDSVYTLNLKYADPFLKGGYIVAKSTNSEPSNTTRRNISRRIKPQSTPKKEVPIVWPEIQFSGIIINDKSKEKLGLVVVNSESYLIKPGEKREGVTLEKLFADSIQVSFKDKFKTIEKSN